METGGHDPLFYRAVGTILGTIAGLAYMPSKNLRDAISRVIVASIAGMTVYFVPMEFFGWDDSRDKIVAGALVMAFASWKLAGMLIKWADKRTE